MISRSDLRSIPDLYRQILRDKEQLRYLREKATSLPSSFTDGERIQSSPANNQNKYIDAAVDLNREIEAKETKLLDLQSEAREFITTVEDPLTRRALKYRYLRCCTWSEVARLVGYTERHLYRLECEAISVLE